MTKKFRNSLFIKVFAITAILLLCISLFVFGALAILMPQTYSNELNRVLAQQTQNFIDELEQETYQNSAGLFDQFLQNNDIVRVKLYADHGRQLPIPAKQAQADESIPMAYQAAEGMTVTNVRETALPEKTAVLSNSFYFSFADSTAKYMLVVYGKAAQIPELQKSFKQIFPAVLAVIIVIASLASWLYSRVITLPVLKISKIATKMSDMQLDWKLDEKRTDELGVLEKSLNVLSQKLQTALSDLKNANARLEADLEHEKVLEQIQLDFFSAASHELKTPITIIKGQLEGMFLSIGAYKDREKYLSRSLEVANTLEIMVQEILTISRLGTSYADLKMERFDCVPIIQGYLRETEDLIVSKDLQVNLHVPQSVKVRGKIFLIEKIFSNLIGNAIKYSPRGAVIDIIACKQLDKYLLCIENSGTHIPEEAFPKLFDAFYRVEQSRGRKSGGSGLGLYIVQKILRQHHSYCSVSNTKIGVRFSFELSF